MTGVDEHEDLMNGQDLAGFLYRLEQNPDAAHLLPHIAFDDLLRFLPKKRMIVSGRFHDQPAVFRFQLSRHPEADVKEWEELQRTSPYMLSGPYQVNRPLHYEPRLRMLVVAFVEGKTVFETLRSAAKPDRAAIVLQTAAWLQHYAQASEREQAARTASWLNKAEKMLREQPLPRFRRVKSELLTQLYALAPQLQGQDWRTAICHGDFHGNNLILNEGILTGVDTGGSSRLPIYKDIARFLVHLSKRNGPQHDRQWLGVDKPYFDAFADAFSFSDIERDLFLPFMIGVEALVRVDKPGLNPERRQKALRFYRRLLSDLPKVTA